MSAIDTDTPITDRPEPRAPAVAASRAESAAVVALLLILAMAAVFRFTGINWDSGTHLHPDERFLTDLASNLRTNDSPLDYLRTSVSTLNPYNVGRDFYVYGNFPMTMTIHAAEWATRVCDLMSERAGEPWCERVYTGYDGVHIVGRFLSALLDVLTVGVTFLIGRRLYGRWAGLIAAFLMAASVMAIQQSHFFTTDNWATFFTTAAIYAAVRAATIGDAEPRWRLRWYVAFGLALGLAAASRINMVPLALIVNVSALVWLARRMGRGGEGEKGGKGDGEQRSRGAEEFPESSLVTRHSSLDAQNSYLVSRISHLPPRDFERAVIAVALAAAVFILTFRIAQPYAFMDAEMVRQRALAETGVEPSALVVGVKSIIGLNPQFLANMESIQGQQAPEALFPPAVQWVDRPAILFPLSNMILYGMGLTAGLFAWFATLWAAWRIFKPDTRYDAFVPERLRDTSEENAPLVSRISYLVSREWMLHAIPVSWTLLYFLYMGTRWVKSVRYFLPIYPTLFVLAGWGIVFLWQWAKKRDELRVTSDELRVARYEIRDTRYEPGATSDELRVTSGLGDAAVRPRTAGFGYWRVLVGVLAAAILLPSLLWAVTFTRIYRQPFTRIAASEWIFAHVPSGATLLYDAADGVTRELNLPLKGWVFVEMGAPLHLDFTMPEGGVIRAVRFNYLDDPDFDNEGAADDAESIRVRVNEGEAVEHPLALDGERRAVIVALPNVSVQEGQPVRLSVEAGGGGPIRAGTSLLVNEVWDDLLPASVGGRNAYGSYYTEVTGGQRPVVHPDSPEKREEVIRWLDEADYIAISSQRAIWSLPRIPLTYPLMIEYYESLFDGSLGFELAAEFHEDTWLGPLYISDTTGQIGWGQRPNIGWPPPNELAAEEAFSVYDHPPVWIFRKTEAYSSENTRALLERVDLSNVIVQNPLEATRAKGGLMLTDAERAIQRAGGTFREVFNLDGTIAEHPWLSAVTWLVALVLLGWAAFPLAFVALGGLPDRGYALSRVLGLLVISWLSWLAASVELLPFTRWTILMALFVLLAVSALLAARRRDEMSDFLRRRAGTIVTVELLGVALFLLMVGIRLGNPDVWDVIWGGEKPMDLSYFTAVMRSTTFPPYDPWLAGGYINYYYYGFVFVGAFVKLFGTLPAVAYNLALPMLYSMTGMGVFSLAWNLVTAVRRVDEEPVAEPSQPDRLSYRLTPATTAGLIAVALALLLGNLAQVRTISNAWYAAGSDSLETLPVVGRAARILDGGVKVMSGTPAPIYPGDWFWTATRAIGADPGEVQPITEFPYFTFLYGDLHAHMISMPLQMLALGWAVGVVLAAERRWGEGGKGRKGAEEQRGRGEGVKGRKGAGAGSLVSRISYLVSLFVGSLAIGVLRPTNTWDWPTYMLLGVLAVIYAVWRVYGLTWAAVGRALFGVVALFGLSSLAFLPFTARYGSGYSSASLWPGSYTSLTDYLFVHGLFLFLVITHLVIEYRDWAGWAREHWPPDGFRRMLALALGLALALVAVALLRGYQAGLAGLPVLVAAGLLTLRPELPIGRRVVAALMAAAVGLTMVVEVVVLDGDVGRMNTVFKFYLQVWLMLSVACGAATVWAWGTIRRSERARGPWQAALGVLVFAALLYPLLATPAKWNIRMNKEAPRTLDGAAFLPYVEYGDTDYAGNSVTIRPGDDVGGIEWLQRHVDGSPVIIEAFGGNPYRSIAARVAMYTGLPSVVGWDWHQRQQRATTPGSIVTGRIDDVNNFYSTVDSAVARNILEKYNVEYVFLGTLENAYYWPEGLAKFDRMIAEGTLGEVYNDGATRILRVTSDG